MSEIKPGDRVTYCVARSNSRGITYTCKDGIVVSVQDETCVVKPGPKSIKRFRVGLGDVRLATAPSALTEMLGLAEPK